MRRALLCSGLACAVWFAPSRAWTGSFGLSGYTAGEIRLFLQSPAYPAQADEPQVSYVLEPEFHYRSESRAHQFRLIPFLRLDSIDSNRTHADVREAYWRYSGGAWRVLIGIDRVFWGVAESRHLVDIVNQIDGVEDVDDEVKLGQPMLRIGSHQRWGDVQVFVMPYFRERTFAGPEGRPRTQPPVSEDAVYESAAEDTHVDAAVRYAHTVGNWDLGASYFYGTSREPVLVPVEELPRLTPLYDVIHQVGLDMQYTHEAWLWKFEGILRDGHDDQFSAMVGGMEHTWFQVRGSPVDIGLLLEYAYDGRAPLRAPPTVFDNDLYAGLRLSLNDVQTTEALVGALVDLDTGSTLASLEARRRLGDAWSLVLTGRFFADVAQEVFETFFERDSYVDISLRRYF